MIENNNHQISNNCCWDNHVCEGSRKTLSDKRKNSLSFGKSHCYVNAKIIKSFCTILKIRKNEDFSCSSMRPVTSAYLIIQQEMAIRSS